jgi:O-antigen ligase
MDEWPWAGPMFLESSVNDSDDDPHSGFALDVVSVVKRQTSNDIFVSPGVYGANTLTAYAIFGGDWEFSELGADIPQDGPATITLNFVGTQLAVTVRRADYRAYLYVTIDGQPANALPKAANGDAYVILNSPDLQPHIDTITLASGLAPGPHTALIRADRGWDQWAIVSFSIGENVARPDVHWPLAIVIIVGLASLGGAIYSLGQLRSPPRSNHTASNLQSPISNLYARLGDLGQTLLTALVSAVLWASAWLTWGEKFANEFRKYGDTAPFIITALTAGIFYYSPFLILTLLSLAALFVLIYLRPDLSLPLIAFFAPFYLLPRPLWDRAFSMVEICTVLGLAATVVRLIPHLSLDVLRFSSVKRHTTNVTLLDWAVIAFVVVSGLTMFTADVQGVAIREFRVVVLEPALFYFLLRVNLTPTPGPFPNPELRSSEGEGRVWRVIDFFLLGAVVVALYGLSNLITGQNLITAEGGVARIRSVFGSPNNLGLYLGRAIPVAAAVVLLGSRHPRRIAYGIALLPLLAAAVFSFSRGALVLGIPAGLAVVLLFWGGRRAAVALGVLATMGGLALIPLSSNPRFADLFSISSGTGFFRINVWRSAWAMFVDHPWLGVGLDNFLYAYRGRYIQPEAWQEPHLPHAHNIFLDALTRTGLLGIIALLAILFAFFRLALNCLRATRDKPDLCAITVGLLASMISTLAHGMVDTAFWFVDLGFVFMLTLGVMQALSRKATAEHAESAATLESSPRTLRSSR